MPRKLELLLYKFLFLKPWKILVLLLLLPLPAIVAGAKGWIAGFLIGGYLNFLVVYCWPVVLIHYLCKEKSMLPLETLKKINFLAITSAISMGLPFIFYFYLSDQQASAWWIFLLATSILYSMVCSINYMWLSAKSFCYVELWQQDPNYYKILDTFLLFILVGLTPIALHKRLLTIDIRKR